MCTQKASQWPYGFPELHREPILILTYCKCPEVQCPYFCPQKYSSPQTHLLHAALLPINILGMQIPTLF
jgi:hypothetical protein